MRLLGEPDEETIERLAATVRGTVLRRIAGIRRELGHTGAAAFRPPPAPAPASDAGGTALSGWTAADTYQLPSYDRGGEPVSIPLLVSVQPPPPHEVLLEALRADVGRLGPRAALAEQDALIAADERETVDASGVTETGERARADLTVRRAARAALVAEIDRYGEMFAADVRALAFEYLDRNKAYLYHRRRLLGTGLPAAGRTPEQAERLANLRRLALAPVEALRLRRRLREIPLGTIWTGGLIDSRMPVRYEPPGKPLTYRPLPGAPSWEQVKEWDDRLAALIAARARAVPEIYLLLRERTLESLVEADPAGQAGAVDAALRDLDRNIEDARDLLATGDLDWRDLQPLHGQLMSGTRSASGTDWSRPYPRQVVAAMLADHRAREFWKQLGLDALAMAAFLFAELATGGLATVFLLGGLGISGYQVAGAWQRAGALTTARGATAAEDLALVTQEQVLAADEAALLTTVFAVSAAVEGVASRAGRLLVAEELPKLAQRVRLSPATLPQYASKQSFMDAMRARLLAQRAAGKPSVLDFLLTTNGEWQTGSFLSKSGRQMRGRYALSNPDAQLVQAGHLQSDVYAKAAGKREYLMLEDADLNWLTGQTGEAKGAIVSKPAVLIDGYPVDIPTARLYEGHGLLPSGTVDAAPLIEPPGL